MSSGKAVTVNSEQYFAIPLDVPEGGTSLDGEVYTYSPNDITPADVDGDGEYELILKWEPSNSFDSGKTAKYTGNVYIDCYKISGEKLWRIDMGININAGAHFTQMSAYDFDLDGKAELALKTAPGTVDGTGKFVSEASLSEEIKSTDNTADYRHSEYGISDTDGRVMSGPEFYTVFQGDTGEALDTVYYPHPRDDGYWGDNWGNRSERYLAGVAYLDGETPSMIAWRGYYAKTTVTAYNLVDKRLVKTADFDTDDGENYMYAGNGNHNLTVGDVDGDGRDELLSGSLALDDDLSVLWCSGRGHGDALHLADYDPTHEGLEYMSVHEDYSGSAITGSTTGNDGEPHLGGMTLYKAENGEELFHADTGADTGRGMMANVGYSDGYFDFWGAGNYTSYGGDNISSGSYYPSSTNQRIFWNGDVYDELLDGTGSGNSGSQIGISDSRGRIASFREVITNNGSKNNPCLIADLFGDWREEFVARSSDNSSLRIYTTIIPTENKLYTLMHDRAYRMQVACQNAGYNQPPHIGYYINNENDESDMRKYSSYIKTVHEGSIAYRTQNTPDERPDIEVTPTPTTYPKPTPTPTPKPTPTIAPSTEYIVEDGILKKYYGSAADLSIPASYQGLRIYCIGGEAFEGNNKIKSVIIENGIEEIMSYAFKNCTSLTEVTIGEGVKFVAGYAFAGCTSLSKLIVLDSSTEINALFDSYSTYANLTIYGFTGSTAEAYAQKNNISFVALNSTTEPTATPTAVPTATPAPTPTAVPEPTPTPVPDFVVDESGVLVEYNGNNVDVVIPETISGIDVLEIGAAVFEDRTDIKTVTLPESVKVIQRAAFSGCTSLERINTNNIEDVYEYAFYNCSSIEELTFEQDVMFGWRAFDGCNNLQKMTLKGMNTSTDGLSGNVNVYGFKSSIAEYTALMADIPFYDIETGERVTKDFIVHPLEGVLMMYRGNDTEIYIPAEVDGVEISALYSAFAYSDIESVVMPDTITKIYYGAFNFCAKLKNVTVSAGVTHLGNSFFGCESLEKIIITPSVTDIEDGIFTTCPNVVIYGGENSAAQSYAESNGIPFVIKSYDDPTPAPTATPSPAPTSTPMPVQDDYPYEIISAGSGGNVSGGRISIVLHCNERVDNVSLIFAEYDENDNLVGIQLKPLDISEGSNHK